MDDASRTHVDSLTRAAGRLRRRAATAAFLGTLAVHLTAALFAAGALALSLRFLGDLDRQPALWCLALLLVAPLTAWLHARRRFLSAGGAGAWMDVRSGGGGLVVTGLETGDPRWAARAEELLGARPAPALAAERMFAPVLPAALFVAAAYWVDVPVEPPGPPIAVYDAALDRLSEKLETLEEEVQLDDEVAEELDQQLSDLQDESSGASPEAAFEAMDRLEERIEELANQAAAEAQEAMEALDAAREEAQGEDYDPGDAAESMAAALESISENGLGGELSPSLEETLADLGLPGLELPEGMELSAGETLELSEELLEKLREMLANLDAQDLLSAHAGELRQLTAEELENLRFVEHECDEDCEAGGT